MAVEKSLTLGLFHRAAIQKKSFFTYIYTVCVCVCVCVPCHLYLYGASFTVINRKIIIKHKNKMSVKMSVVPLVYNIYTLYSLFQWCIYTK